MSAMPGNAEEKEAIRDVLATYCFCLDEGRFAEMAALFTPDGVWDTAFGKGVGRDGIEALVRRMRDSRPANERHRGVHLCTNVSIRLDGETARVLSNWMVARTVPPARSSAPPAATRMRWSSGTAPGFSGTAGSTASSPPT
jgi:uncharacterized protein (TIGR02246 family)